MKQRVEKTKLHNIKSVSEKETINEFKDKYKIIFDVVPASIILLNRYGKIIDINPYHLRHIARGKIPKKDFIGKNIVTHPTVVNAGLSETYREVFIGKAFNKQKVYFPSLLPGGDGYFNVKGIPLFKDGKVSGAIIIHEDITERKRVEEELKKSEDKYRYLFDQSLTISLIVGIDGTIVNANKSGVKGLGYEKDEVIGKNTLEFVVPEHREIVTKHLEMEFRGEYTPLLDIDVYAKDKSIHSILFMPGGVMLYERGKLNSVLITGMDITERKRIEEELRQSEKMKAVGQLAGGIAHDFNNQLAGIIGLAEMLRKHLEDNKEFYDYADMILKTAKRSANLTEQLLAFSRKGKYQSVLVDIHEIIAEVVSLVKHSMDDEITIEQNLRADSPFTKGDPNQLQNALLNIVINARDAMPKGGNIILSTDVVKLSKKYCKSSNYKISPAEYIQIYVSDTGSGIDKRIKNRIFEPFFSTKKNGKGTGMGLAAVDGIVRNHHGAISISTQPGIGTTFEIYLPLAEYEKRLESAKTSKIAKSAKKAIKGNALILVVEDEEIVLKILVRVIEMLGYTVITFINGRDALEYYRKSWFKVDCVILDMIMPEMSGKETFIEMKKINPKIRALLSSGYSIDVETRKFLKESKLSFIKKPFQVTELSQKIMEVLNYKN